MILLKMLSLQNKLMPCYHHHYSAICVVLISKPHHTKHNVYVCMCVSLLSKYKQYYLSFIRNYKKLLLIHKWKRLNTSKKKHFFLHLLKNRYLVFSLSLSVCISYTWPWKSGDIFRFIFHFLAKQNQNWSSALSFYYHSIILQSGKKIKLFIIFLAFSFFLSF